MTGTPATLVFLVYTKDKAATIGPIRNGYLGWHYVDRVDTCVYMAQPVALAKGTNTVTWDGKNNDKALVQPGDYTYYLWGYDNVNNKTLMSNVVSLNYNSGNIITHNADGTAKAQPDWYSPWGVGEQKWVIGGDPADATLLETTSIDVPAGWSQNIHIAFEPTDQSKYFVLFKNNDGGTGNILKMSWVPNGASLSDTGWGENGRFVYETPVGWSALGGVQRVGDYLFATNVHYYTADALSELLWVDMGDGSLLRKVDLSDWWSRVNDRDAGGQMNGGPFQLYEQNGFLFGSSFCQCLRGMFDPMRASDDNVVVWYNDNGDYMGDHNFDPSDHLKWVCMDFNVAPYAYVSGIDSNLFWSFGAYDLGSVSFGLFGPDGRGIDYFAFAGETAQVKTGTLYVDYNSPFDGIYTDNNSTGKEGNTGGTWFVGHDSIKGIITDQVGVNEAAPSAFAVSQNSPNPFNPTTTISFTLAKAGKTTVEVYNVAGQKISTLVNANLSAGAHSTVWNAKNASAGVYFYTVKSGNSSKTMKMTLLK